MNVLILNKEFEKLGVIEGANVIWHPCYNSVGDFEVYIKTDDVDIELLQTDFYVMREDDDYTGIIEDMTLNEDEDGIEHITVKGRFAECLLERRIIWDKIQIDGLVEDGLRSIIRENVISPTLPERAIKEIELGEYKNFTEIINTQYYGENVLEVIKTICNTYNLGFKLLYDNKKFKFELYKGIDRSYNQTINPYVTFSDVYGNLKSSNFIQSISQEKNVALVYGEEDSNGVFTATVGTVEGIDRKEMYVDGSGVTSEDGAVITDDEYKILLEKKGIEEIAKTKTTIIFENEIDLTDSYEYKKHFNLGDIVTIEDTRLNIFENLRISEILESEDENGYSIIPTLVSEKGGENDN